MNTLKINNSEIITKLTRKFANNFKTKEPIDCTLIMSECLIDILKDIRDNSTDINIEIIRWIVIKNLIINSK